MASIGSHHNKSQPIAIHNAICLVAQYSPTIGGSTTSLLTHRNVACISNFLIVLSNKPVAVVANISASYDCHSWVNSSYSSVFVWHDDSSLSIVEGEVWNVAFDMKWISFDIYNSFIKRRLTFWLMAHSSTHALHLHTHRKEQPNFVYRIIFHSAFVWFILISFFDAFFVSMLL